jgi:amino acid transporter
MDKFSKIKINPWIYFLIFSLLFILPCVVLAQGGLEETAKEAGLQSQGSVPVILGKVAGAALALAGSIFLFLVIYGGIIIMTSAGSERVKKGKDIITWAIIGALLLGAAYALTAFIFGIFTGTPPGNDQTQQTPPPGNTP